jgi:hypothetical protein
MLVDYIWTIFSRMQEHQDEGMFYMSLFFGSERQWFLEDIKQVVAAADELSAQFIRKLIGAGLLQAGCEEDFVRTLRGMIDVWRWASVTEGVVLSREIAERIVDNLLNGFGVRQSKNGAS